MSENQEYQHLTISEWAEDDKPREKLMAKGPKALSIAELIAILFGTGTVSKSGRLTAVGLGQQVLEHCNKDLFRLATISIKELKEVHGVGTAKAVTLKAALELGRRIRHDSENRKVETILGPQDIYDYISPYLAYEQSELLYAIFLRRNQSVINHVLLSEGGRAGTLVDVAKIFKHALLHDAAALILCHNHPSGNPKPSDDDIKATKQVQEAGKVMDIKLLDHLIYTDSGKYTSLAEEGLF